MNIFKIKKKIYYHDTDWSGVVYYANYLKFFEEARAEHLRSKGIDLKRLAEEEGTLFAVAEADIKYKSPARYGDEISVSSVVEKIKTASIYFYQEIKKGDLLLTECRLRLVCINKNFKPVTIPKRITDIM